MKTKTKHGDETRRITSTRNLATATPPPAAAALPYTIPQVLANLREFVSIIAKTAASADSEEAWILWVSENILARGIVPEHATTPPSAQHTPETLVWKTWHHVPFDNAAMTNAVVALHRADPYAEIAQLRAALAHALAFIEHDHPNFDDPITEIDSFTSSADGGPEMECNLS